MHQKDGHLTARYADRKMIIIRSIYVIVDDNTVEMVCEGYYPSCKYNFTNIKYNFTNMKLSKWVI